LRVREGEVTGFRGLEAILLSMINAVLFLAELAGCVEALLEVFLNCGGRLVFLVLGQATGLFALERGHRSMEFLVCSYEFALGSCEDINILGIDLDFEDKYMREFLIVSECVSEVEFGLVSPSVGIAVSPVGQSDIEIAAGTVTDIVYKFIGASMVVFEGMFSVLGF